METKNNENFLKKASRKDIVSKVIESLNDEGYKINYKDVDLILRKYAEEIGNFLYDGYKVLIPTVGLFSLKTIKPTDKVTVDRNGVVKFIKYNEGDAYNAVTFKTDKDLKEDLRDKTFNNLFIEKKRDKVITPFEAMGRKLLSDIYNEYEGKITEAEMSKIWRKRWQEMGYKLNQVDDEIPEDEAENENKEFEIDGEYIDTVFDF